MLQKLYLIPSVSSVWVKQQSELLRNLQQEKEIVLGGDCRCDSPGHSAKYGSYSFMELNSNKVIDIQLVQVNEVKNSAGMEIEGFKRGLHFLKDKGLSIKRIVTDRHVQVKKYLREHHPDIEHRFDVWHMAKDTACVYIIYRYV